MFADSLPLAEKFADLLATDGVDRGLIGPREAPRLWERHLLNCAVLSDGIPGDSAVCDIGSGAGLPGLVLAIRRPDLQVTLVEPLLRRTAFLSEAVTELGLGNVEVVRARAEELHGVRDFDLVTSRAVAPLERLLGWSMPLVRRGGTMLAMKGSSVHNEVATATDSLRRVGAGAIEVVSFGAGQIDPPTTAVRVEATASPPLGSGTRPGTPGRRSTSNRKRPRTRDGD